VQCACGARRVLPEAVEAPWQPLAKHKSSEYGVAAARPPEAGTGNIEAEGIYRAGKVREEGRRVKGRVGS